MWERQQQCEVDKERNDEESKAQLNSEIKVCKLRRLFATWKPDAFFNDPGSAPKSPVIATVKILFVRARALRRFSLYGVVVYKRIFFYYFKCLSKYVYITYTKILNPLLFSFIDALENWVMLYMNYNNF